jgi:phage shock protein PspC (stress-responsive transcriptional regulator)
METTERLYRSKTNKVIGGVAGGLANYFTIDTVLIRVAFVLLAMFGGGGVLIYIVMWIVIPVKPGYTKTQNQNFDNTSDEDHLYDQNITKDDIPDPNKPVKNSNTALITGIILIFMGLIFLADRLMPWYNITDFWPLLLVVVGVIMIKPDIFKPSKKQNNEI